MPVCVDSEPTGMTPSEHTAWHWLLDTEGYNVNTLHFYRSGSPDFIGDDGRGWEVKIAPRRTILFTTSTQVMTLRERRNCYLLIFAGSRSAAPEAVASTHTLDAVPGTWNGYRLTVCDGVPASVRMSTDLHSLIRVAAASRRQSVRRWMLAALQAAVLRQSPAGGNDTTLAAALDAARGERE